MSSRYYPFVGQNPEPTWTLHISNVHTGDVYDLKTEHDRVYVETPLPVLLRCELCVAPTQGFVFFVRRWYDAEVDALFTTLQGIESLPLPADDLPLRA